MTFTLTLHAWYLPALVCLSMPCALFWPRKGNYVEAAFHFCIAIMVSALAWVMFGFYMLGRHGG